MYLLIADNQPESIYILREKGTNQQSCLNNYDKKEKTQTKIICPFSISVFLIKLEHIGCFKEHNLTLRNNFAIITNCVLNHAHIPG